MIEKKHTDLRELPGLESLGWRLAFISLKRWGFTVQLVI